MLGHYEYNELNKPNFPAANMNSLGWTNQVDNQISIILIVHVYVDVYVYVRIGQSSWVLQGPNPYHYLKWWETAIPQCTSQLSGRR